MTSTAAPRHAARRRIVPVFCGISGSNSARRICAVRACPYPLILRHGVALAVRARNNSVRHVPRPSFSPRFFLSATHPPLRGPATMAEAEAHGHGGETRRDFILL